MQEFMLTHCYIIITVRCASFLVRWLYYDGTVGSLDVSRHSSVEQVCQRCATS